MDSSDTDAYTPILARGQRPYRHQHQQHQQHHLAQSAQQPRARYVSGSVASPTTTSASFTALPEYSPKLTSPSSSDAPPTYTDVDAEDEGEDEGDDKAFPLPTTSPRSQRRSLTTTRTNGATDSRRRASSLQGKRRSSASRSLNNESNDDLYLDGLLARSVHALELSNALLQSTMSTKTSLASVLHSEDVLDRSLARQQRNISATLCEGQQMQAAWMGEMRDVVEDVEDLFDDGEHPHSMRDEYEYWPRAAVTTGSLPSTSSSPLSSLSPRRPSTRALLPEHSRTTSTSSGGGLRRGERPRSPPPRALTQYVSVAHSKGTTTETTAAGDSIYLPSTTGLRAAAHVEEFGSPTSGRAGLGFLDPDPDGGSGWGVHTQGGRRAYDVHLERVAGPQRDPDHAPARASHYKSSPAKKAAPARRQESWKPHRRDYINPALSLSTSVLSPTRSTFPDTLKPSRALLPPLSVSPPPRIVIERRSSHTSPPHSPATTAAPAPVIPPRHPYTHRSPPRVAWSTPDLTTASLLLHTLQQPGYRPSSRSRASSASSRSSSSRLQQPQPQPHHPHQQGRVHPVPYSTTFNPERYFAGLEPIADSEPECARSDLEYDRDKTVRSKGKDRASLLLEDDEERNQATVKRTEKEKGRTFVSAQWLRKLLDTSPAPGSKNDMLAVQSQPPEPPRERMMHTSAKSTNHRPIPKRRSASALNVVPRFLPSPSNLPSTSTSTATASVARLKAIPLTPEEEEKEKRRVAERRRSGMKGSRQGSATGTPVMGLTPLAPAPLASGAGGLPLPPSDAASNSSISGSSTPLSVSFAVEPPKYSEERERSGEGGRRVERKTKRKKRKDGDGDDGDGEERGGWMSWFLDVSSGMPPPGAVVSGRFEERMGGRGPGGGGAFDFGL